MRYFMPEIIYHDRKPLLSVDVHPLIEGGKYRMATSSVQDTIGLWELEIQNGNEVTHNNTSLGLCFIASLEGHYTTVTQVRFSPNAEVKLLASGDVHGRIFIWKLSNSHCTDKPVNGFPQNREKWIRFKVFYHESDVTSICWHPCGRYIASVSGDATLRVHDGLTGRHKFVVRNLRYYPNGVSYDPLGKYIVTMSTDRKMDLICAEKGTRLRNFVSIPMPHLIVEGIEFHEKRYNMFADDVFTSYTRIPSFSPCGQLLVAPAGRLQTSPHNTFYCSYVYKRTALDQDKPIVILRSPKNPTFLIKFCPIVFELVQGSPNYSELPYRIIWLALTQEEVIFYDSQHPNAIAFVKDITYRGLSDATWTKDGRMVLVSDTEEYMHYIHFMAGEFGNETEIVPLITDSLCFKKKSIARKAMKKVVNGLKSIVNSEKIAENMDKDSETVREGNMETSEAMVLQEAVEPSEDIVLIDETCSNTSLKEDINCIVLSEDDVILDAVVYNDHRIALY